MLKLLELFGGIGACTQALKRLNIPFEIADYVEIDKYAVKSYNAINNTNFEPQDITKWNKNINVDLIMHGSPCQDFSLAGLQAGGDEGSGTRSSLMFETIRIVEKLKPKYVIWENVKNVVSKKHRHNFDAYLEKMKLLGYMNQWMILNAKDYGVPQNRERVFCISILNGGAFTFPKGFPLKLRLKDILEDKVDQKYYMSNKALDYICATGTKNFSYKPEIDLEIARPLTTTMHKSHRASQDNYVSDSFLKDNIKVKIENGKPIIPQNPQVINIGNVNPSRKGINGMVIDSEGLARTVTQEKGEGQKILVREATKAGYAEAQYGDSVNLEQPNSKTRRGRVGHQVAQTLTTSCNQAVVVRSNLEKYYVSEKGVKYIVDSKRGMATDINSDVCQPLTAVGNSNWTGSFISPNIDHLEKSTTIGGVEPTNIVMKTGETITQNDDLSGLRIRKLTPKECWRLMGFSDEVFEKAEKVNSNTQLYKQAGNSIVVDVLVKIFTNLFMEEEEMKKVSEKKTVTIETDKMIDLVALQEKEPELFEELATDYPCEDATYIFEVKAE